jgi:Fe-Mn family superoxide dismutase
MQMNRREFIKLSAGGGALALAGMAGFGCNRKSQNALPAIELPPLPYKENALEPYISAQTVGFHYRKHHRGYVNNTNKLIAQTRFAHMTLPEIIAKTRGVAAHRVLFNNAAQVWNHSFYWNSMKPGGGGAAHGKIAKGIETSFGSFETFYQAFTQAAVTLFGSGWTWLVKDDKGLSIVQTADADTPIGSNAVPLLTLDVWEHAYYLDYQNRRADYVKAWLDHLVNWEFAETTLGGNA